ncbi:MAG: amidohydrolase, partial [Planctomycetota bacterium]
YAELGLQEHKSSAALISELEAAGFTIRRNVAGMPTAFVASFGEGRPVIGILAEYDALPGMSQDVVSYRKPIEEGAPGHACGHSGLGAGALGAALAVRHALQRHGLKGTIRLYGTPAEETAIGKVYMLLAGEFKDLDVCLHWHPSTKNGVWAGSSKALVSAKFTFHGLSAHASGNPEKGRSALDAVELMNVGVNYMREHVAEDARLHYVITDGGGAPNVVPAKATVWYFVRADSHEDVERYFAWVVDIARGAALMTRTRMEYHVDTDCHELIPNTPLAELLQTYLQRVGPPKFSPQELEFARRLQQPLIEEFKARLPEPLETKVLSLQEGRKPSKGSTDVGDISWFVPTGGIRTTCFAAGSPGHSWQNVACIGSSIGEKGTLYAAKVLAAAALHLFEHPEAIASAKADFQQRIRNRKYTTLIPKGQKPPVRIR